MGWIIVAIAAALGLYMAWNIGANDVANSMADAVGSGAISIKRAIIAAGVCEFAGAVLVGTHVTDTVRKGIITPQALEGAPAVMALGMACALLAAALCLHLASWWSMPVSTTHAIVGAVTGFGIVAAGWGAVEWGTMGEIVASWFISPVLGGILAFAFFKLIAWGVLGRRRPVSAARTIMPFIAFFVTVVISLATVYKGLKHIVGETPWLAGQTPIYLSVGAGLLAAAVTWVLVRHYLAENGTKKLEKQLERVERVFGPFVIITSCAVAFAHGSNDVANAVGPLAAVAQIVRSGEVQTAVPVPFWILALGGGGITLGLAMYGYRVMITVGEKITQITPSRGVAADVAATITVLVCSRMGIPVSTTHTLVGAILGVGFARGLGAINRDVTRNIFGSWLLTVPAAAILSMILFIVSRVFLLEAVEKLIQVT